MRKSHEFHVFPAGAAPLDPAHIRTHESIVKLGRCFAIVGRPIAVLAFLVAAVAYSMTLGKETVIHTVLHVIGFLLMLPILFAIPVGLYFYGASLALLFTRYEFLTGPIGQKWLKVGGVKNPVTAKICYFLLLTIPLFLIYVIISAINQGIL